jgi:hypothetical protein
VCFKGVRPPLMQLIDLRQASSFRISHTHSPAKSVGRRLVAALTHTHTRKIRVKNRGENKFPAAAALETGRLILIIHY